MNKIINFFKFFLGYHKCFSCGKWVKQKDIAYREEWLFYERTRCKSCNSERKK